MGVLLRILGALPLLFGLLGLVATWTARGMQFAVPALEGAPWTEGVRGQADFVLAFLFVLTGLQLVRARGARAFAWSTLGLALARWLFDLAAADATTARGRTILQGDLVALAVAVVGLVLALLAARGSPSDAERG